MNTPQTNSLPETAARTGEACSEQRLVSPSEPPKREERKWWAVADGRVEYVTGYICPKNPGIWWCPEMGYSMTEGYALFETEVEALAKAITEAEAEAVALEKRLNALKARRAKVHDELNRRRT